MQTWGNRADAFVRQAELVAEGAGEQAGRESSQQAYEQGMEAYATACSLTSTEQGDDLPGLLHNWGVGLRSMAEHTAVRSSFVAWRCCVSWCGCATWHVVKLVKISLYTPAVADLMQFVGLIDELSVDM